jgi:hypothetical protein
MGNSGNSPGISERRASGRDQDLKDLEELPKPGGGNLKDTIECRSLRPFFTIGVRINKRTLSPRRKERKE